MGYVYLIHFTRPIAAGHPCQHYIGSAESVPDRLAAHKAGRGARLTQVANERGIDYGVVRIWEAEPGEERALERRLKNQKMGPALCPVCSERRRRQYQPGLLTDFTLADVPAMAF